MARAKRDEAEIQATVAALPLEPSAEVIEKAKARCNADYLIYKAGYWTEPLTGEKEKTALVHCTACGEEVHLGRWDYPHAGCRFAYSTEKIGFLDPADNMQKGSYDSCICPCCGKGVEALHVSRIKNEYVMCSFVFMTLHNVRGHFVLLSWKLFKRCDKSGKVRFDLFRRDGWAVIGGVPIWFTGYTTGGYGGASWEENWLVRPRFSCDIEEWDEDEILEFNPHVLWTSDGEKSALDVFIKECGEEIPIVAYLVAWAKYPQIENLVRSGYSLYVRRLLNACIFTSGYYYSSKKTFYISGIKKYIDIKKVKPHEILRIEKMDMYLVNILSLEELALYGTVWKKKKIKISIEQIREAKRWNFSSMKELMEDYAPSYQKVLSYLDKQSKKKVRKKTVSINAGYLKDYWGMVKNVYDGDLPQELMYPKDLRKAHDNIMLRVKEKVDEKLNAQIQAYAKKMSVYAFEDRKLGLCIRPIANQNELIKEGKLLHHCVASYAESYAKRRTCIFAIRKIKEPDKPYFTLEYKNGMVNQNQGANHASATGSVKAFTSEWLEFIKNKEIEDVKRSGGKNGQSACA